MNMSIKPDERQLVGEWEPSAIGVRAGVVAKRIEYLIANELVEVAASKDGWSVLYQDKNDKRYWELTFPSSGLHGGGPPSLTCLSAEDAQATFSI